MTRRGFLARLLAMAGAAVLAHGGHAAGAERILLAEEGGALVTESGEFLGWA